MIIIPLEGLPDEFSFPETLNPLGNVNSMIHAIESKPTNCYNEKMLSKLFSYTDSELIHFKIKSNVPLIPPDTDKECSELEFVNPFPTIQETEGIEVINDVIKFLDVLKWRGALSSNILELSLDELQNSIVTLMLCKFHINFSQRAFMSLLFTSSNR